MNPWDAYRSRLDANGGDRRGAALQREHRFLNTKMSASISYHQVAVNGKQQSLAIMDSDNLGTKTLCSLPGENLPHGGVVDWMDNHWLIVARDANDELYTRGTMKQCNYLLRWIADDGTVVERWCIIEDGTKLEYAAALNSLAYWKRCVKTIPLIAGTPLEPYHQNGAANSCIQQRFENGKDWAISSQAPNRRRFNDYPGRGSRSQAASKWGTLNRFMRHGEDIVCALQKV